MQLAEDIGSKVCWIPLKDDNVKQEIESLVTVVQN